MSKASDPVLAAALNALKAIFDGGFIYYFAGAVPADEGDALNMVTTHTQVAKISLNGTATGLTFQTATAGVLAKTPAETWSGLIDFDGFVAGPGTITPSFYRFCPAGDNGRGAAATSRLQGTLGGPSSGADIELVSATATDNGTNTLSLPIFSLNESVLA